MSLPAAATIMTALGAGAILLKLVEVFLQRIFGKQRREQDAWAQRDREAKARRMLEEYATDLRLVLIESGVKIRDIPEWPNYKTTE